jgi:hypothetical protein
MLRKIAAALTISVASFGLLGTGSAGALSLPPGNGSIACSVAGTVKVARSVVHPTVSHLTISGAVSNCTYNGVAIPFAGGATRTVAVGDPAKWCAVLSQGGTIARSVTRVVAFGHVVGVVSATGTLSPAVPSGSGSAISIDGSFVAKTVTVNGHVSVQTDRPVADLCAGATSLSFTGTVSADWTRA